VTRTTRLYLWILAIYGALLLPGAIWPGYLESPVGLLVAVPYLSVYVLDYLGIPGLLANNGACGWGWCAATQFGLGLVAVVWLALGWLLAWLIAVMTTPRDPASRDR
jgi:hypothetical protein